MANANINIIDADTVQNLDEYQLQDLYHYALALHPAAPQESNFCGSFLDFSRFAAALRAAGFKGRSYAALGRAAVVALGELAASKNIDPYTGTRKA